MSCAPARRAIGRGSGMLFAVATLAMTAVQSQLATIFPLTPSSI